jgi:hypothetical protein
VPKIRFASRAADSERYKEVNEKGAIPPPNRRASGPESGTVQPVVSSRPGLVSADRRIGAVPVVSRTRTPFGRSPEQRLRALAKANEVRVARARLKREVAAGRIDLARLVAEPDDLRAEREGT